MTLQLADLVPRADGHDGSHYQVDAGRNAGANPPVDLDALRRTPMAWLAWKVSQSDKGRDPTFPDIDTRAEALDFRNFFGYGWLSSTTDPYAQADNFLRGYGKKRAGKGAMIDAEEKNITVEKFVMKAERIEEELRQPCVGYMGIYVAGGTIFTDPRVRESAYGIRPVIVAAYVTASNLFARLKQMGLLELTIDGWQWTSNGVLMDGRKLPGIIGRADIDAVLDWNAMDRASGRVAVPQPIPVQGDDMLELITNDIYPNPGYSVWALMDDGTKRGISPAEYTARGMRTPRIVSDIDLALIPNYVANTGGAAANFKVTSEVTSHVEPA